MTVYLSSDIIDCEKFFNYHTPQVKHIASHSSFSEISIVEDFIVHYRLWLSSPFNDSPGEQAFISSGFSNAKQLVQVLPRIPDCLGDRPNIFLPLRFIAFSFIAMTVDIDPLNSHCRSVLPPSDCCPTPMILDLSHIIFLRQG